MTTEKYYNKIVEVALDIGERRTSKIQEHQRLLELYGLVGLRVKHFLNALLSEGALNYLEMGVYRGASLTCALYKNPEVTTYAVDNWHYSPIDAPAIKYELDKEGKPTTKTIPWPNVKMAAMDNIKKFVPNTKINWIEKNFSALTKTDIPDPVNVVHLQPNPGALKTELISYLCTITPLLAETSIVIIEHWMMTAVQEAVESWVSLSKVKVESKNIKKSDSNANGDHWWGGICVMVVTKPIVVSK